MNATFFGLAFLAALNPKLLGVDLLLIGNARPRLMFVCFLLGGMSMCLAVGLLDVLVLQADAINTQDSVSAGLDLALGVPLVAIGALVASGRLHGRRRAPVPAGDGPPPKKEGWAQRVLREPRFGVAVLIGALVGTPGASYITALHELVTGKSSTATQAISVVVFAFIEFSLVIIPFAFLVARPEGTKAQLERAQAWFMGHARQLVAAVAMFAGGYMVVSGLVRLLT
jgi:Sap, sulfolipid-1-addressing protein